MIPAAAVKQLHHKTMIILASASPRRIEMLQNAGYDPVVRPASIMENLPFDMKPETATMYLAMKKAFAVADEITPLAEDGLTVHNPIRFPVNGDQPLSGEDIKIIAADTVVVHDGRIISKPKDENDAYRILSALRGTSHHVVTGCCVCSVSYYGQMTLDKAGQYEMRDGQRQAECFYEDTEVFFKTYSNEELRAYVQTDEPYDKAGGYAIQGTFEKYIDHIEGDFDNVVGLPLTTLKQYID